MSVHDAGDVVANLMHGAVNGVPSGIDLVRAVRHFVAGQIDFHQAGRGDFVKHQPVWVDQKVIGFGNLGRDVREDQVIPAMQRDQSVTGRQIDPRLPFGGAHLGFQRRQSVQRSHRGHLFLLS